MHKKKRIIIAGMALLLLIAVSFGLYVLFRAPEAKPEEEMEEEVSTMSYEAQKLAERYANGLAAMEREDWEWALGIFTSLGDYADSARQAEAAQAQIDALEAQRLEDAYAAAEALAYAEDFNGAAEAFLELEDYSDSVFNLMFFAS